ncbi:signal peptidase [Nocardioides ginsengisegetis]|uniref:Signal peptidase I n=1 Tax=Nocardioides ginsengisegetis TaxID=661491 RepID=A0A7W3IYP1_9ACTN|nr:signal peptidase I [Nocardioides ginsengisegetis]MBA8803041.1 signal peptidase [Nocardioides ginsengisegetis]
MIRVSAAARWSLMVGSWFVMLFVAAVLAAALIVPRLAGATPYVIETSSMTPTMPPGTLVVVRPVDQDQIRPGDVITYQIKSGDPTVVTHRVVAQGIDATGQSRWRTQGDANDAMDAGWVLPVQVKGERWYAIPYLGYVTSFVTGQQREVLSILVVLGLIGYAGVNFLGALKERRRKPVVLHIEQPVAARQSDQPVDVRT